MITIGIDPGTSSTGVAVFMEKTRNHDELLFSSQGKPDQMIDEANAVIAPHRRRGIHTKIIAIENLYPGPGKAGPKSIYTLGCTTGYIIGRLKEMGMYNDETWLWRPYPVSWRKHIVIPTGDKETTMNAKNRNEAARMAVQFAQAVSQESMMGPRGGPQIDRAMAVCIGVAAQIQHDRSNAKISGVEPWMKISSG